MVHVENAEGDHRVQPTIAGTVNDERYMARAVEAAASVRAVTSPNPWVGAVLVTASGTYQGATAPPGGPHAEATALRLAADAGDTAVGGTLYTTLEPCAHHGRTPPCADAIVASGVARVVVGVLDPDPRVSGEGVARVERAGIEVVVGVGAAEVREQLAPYLKHRRTGRPWVVLKLAATLDGRTAAPDGSSRWITGPEARRDVHRLRAESDAVLVGAGTVRADDPALTVRDIAVTDIGPTPSGPQPATGPTPTGEAGVDVPLRQPLRVVLGKAPEGAKVHPALELSGDLGAVLDRLGSMDVVQVLVEGGAQVAHALHAEGLVDRYVLYLAPAFFGGDDGSPLFRGAGAPTMADLWRGRVISVVQLGEDLRVELAPAVEAAS